MGGRSANEPATLQREKLINRKISHGKSRGGKAGAGMKHPVLGVGMVQAMPGQKNGGQQGHSQNKRKKRQQFRHSAALLASCSCCRQPMPNFRSLCRDCQPARCLAARWCGPYSPKADTPRKGSFGMYHNKVELCGINTAQLLRRVKQGDRQARQEMIQGNLRLVLSVVQRFSGRGENLDDLFQVGCIGLIKAIDNFDPDLNLRFSTYGVPMIIGEIRRFLRDNNALRVSRSVRDVAYRAMQCREQLQKKLGREPHINEIAKAVNLPKETVTLALESVVEPVSLYEPVYSDGGDPIYVMDQVGETDGEDSWISGIMFRDTVGSLTGREKKIMALRYLSGMTQVEVAKEIGISQAQVSRLEKGALGRIRGEM